MEKRTRLILLGAVLLAALVAAYFLLREPPQTLPPTADATWSKDDPQAPIQRGGDGKAVTQEPPPGNEFKVVLDDNPTYFLSAGDDTASGDSADNIINAGDGNDTVRAGAGDDHVKGGKGNDALFGEDGNDFLKGGLGEDNLEGGDGDDRLVGAEDNDVIDGGDGNDWAIGAEGDDVISGGKGDDRMDGVMGNDTISGDEGNDYVEAGDGNDVVTGGPGNDELIGQDGDDVIRGGPGADVLDGSGGADKYVYLPEDVDGQKDTIKKLQYREGDVIDVSAVLAEGGYSGDGSLQSLQNHLSFENGVLRIDPSGQGNFVDLVAIERTKTDLGALIGANAIKVLP
ncbi:MAG: calcium-binding protein [Bdellovibrionota bacterium]